MIPDNFTIHLKDSPYNASQGEESVYFAQRFARYNEETGEEISEDKMLFFRKSELPIEVQTALDNAFAQVLTFLADK